MQIHTALEYAEIRLPVGALESNGRLRLRQDVLRLGYLDARSNLDASMPKVDTSEVDVPLALFAKGYVGLIPVNTAHAVLVRPRYPAALTTMVTYVDPDSAAHDFLRSTDLLRDYRLQQGVSADWMIEQVATQFLSATHAIIESGLLRTYVTVRETTSSPRGSLRVEETIRKHSSRNVGFLVEAEYYERTYSMPANQALKEGALWVLGWAQRRSLSTILTQARYVLHELRHVVRDPRHDFFRDPLVLGRARPPAAHKGYRRALELARFLLLRQGFSLDADEGGLALSSLLIKTDDLFERFARKHLSERLSPRFIVAKGEELQPKVLLYEAHHIPQDLAEAVTPLPRSSAVINPDILVNRQDGSTALVLDVKYRVTQAHADLSAIQQCILYGARLRCPNVVTVHPCSADQPSGLYVAGRIGDFTVWQYRMNLERDMNDEAIRMADAVERLSLLDQHQSVDS